ncbi:MAG: histidine phosphatase family protein [Clostridia bacterium]|nr:histidine phosphatase family protein [Clostridia bacterium]
MTTLLLIRHGESVANADKVFVGHTDVDLSPKGELQAQKTAEFIKENYKVDKVYASDLKRAYRTGEFVANAFGLDVIADSGLREIYAGSWEGEKFQTLLETNADYAVWKTDIGASCATNGESVRDVWKRIHFKLLEIAILNEGKTIAIATHATPIRCMTARCLGMGLSGMKELPWAVNASVTEITFENDIFMVTKGPQYKHLQGLAVDVPKNV